jgi:hypothetical protein
MSIENNGGMISSEELIHPPELSGNLAEPYTSKAGKTGEGNKFCRTKYLFLTSKVSFNIYHKILCHGADGFITPDGRRAADFHRP